MLISSSLRFLAFLPDHPRDDAAQAMKDIADAVAIHDPDLVPVHGIVEFPLWTAARPVEIPVLSGPDGRSCSIGWMFTGAGPRSELGAWGGFIKFTRDAQMRWSVFRSADGLMTVCAVKTCSGLIIASQIPAWLLKAVGVVPAIDWSVIAAVLADPTITGHKSALRNVTTIPPGCRLEAYVSKPVGKRGLPGDGMQVETVWDPCALAREAVAVPVAVAEERLRGAVEEAVDAWAGSGKHVLLELSGGLDSSILAGTLMRLASDRTITLVNVSTVQVGGDERHYARDVAEACGRPLVEVLADRRVIDVAELRDLVHPSEPILYGLDAGHDVQMTAHANAVGADTIMTGQGGDAVFYQMPDLCIAVDAFRLRGWQALWSKPTFDIAHRARRSMWSAWGAILADRLGRSPPAERFPSPMVTPAAMDQAGTFVHPWLTGLKGLPPAKARQVEAIAHSQLFYGPTLRGHSTLFVHPLLSQPVLEACLSVPVPTLTGGWGDRQRARAAFADRLPGSVAHRHSKGAAASHYSIAVTDAVDDLRALLLGGRLVTRGLLDGAALEEALKPETLLWRDLSRPLMLYASIEAWVRYWERA